MIRGIPLPGGWVTAVAILVVGAGVWVADRLTESPLMRKRINKGTDRYVRDEEFRRLRNRARNHPEITPDLGVGEDMFEE